MKKSFKTLLCILLSTLLLVAVVLPAFSADTPFDENAYANILTGSDFQDVGTKAYDRFGKMLSLMQKDGMGTPDSMLVGGDYTKVLFDYAAPGMTQIRQQLLSVYPDADADTVVCIQGNHDNMTAGFTKTGFYDMGVYCLYVINEDDFPWQQGARPLIEKEIKATADDMTKHFDEMIAAGDLRPVIVITHLPLHHTSRANYADNKYAAYIFNAINTAAETLDILFLFGHQHSGAYDDYIGGAVNFFAPGDALRVPLTDRSGRDCYTEETLNFTYANCGYVGYSNNSDTEYSTSTLTLGVVQLTNDTFHFVKYSEDGFYAAWDVARKNPGAGAEKVRPGYTALADRDFWNREFSFFSMLFNWFRQILHVFGR